MSLIRLFLVIMKIKSFGYNISSSLLRKGTSIKDYSKLKEFGEVFKF